MPPLPPEEITQLMQFIAAKTKNVTSPMNVMKLCRQFKEETGSPVVLKTLGKRIEKCRLKIHEMSEFDMETKVKMMFALSAPIDAGFLIEMQKVAEVEVDGKQRIINYKPNDGTLELSAKYLKFSIDQVERRDRELIQFLAEKAKTTDTPIADRVLLREFKEKCGYTDTIETLEHRYRFAKRTIYQSSEIDKDTKIRMMFISNAKLPDDVLEELRKDAIVEVDEEGRITKYKANNGSLELEGRHEMSSTKKSFYFDRWHTICEKDNEVVSESDGEENVNWQKDFERKRIELVRFLIEKTKNATSPLSIKQLAKDYKTEFKSSESLDTTHDRIRKFRQRIHELNQFDTATKVKMLFALSVPIDSNSMKELQSDAIVELDEMKRIKTYKANDRSLILKGDHSISAKTKAGLANRKTARVVNDSSESEDDGDEENSIESHESDEEKNGKNVGESKRSNQTPTFSSVRRSDRIQKSRISLRNKSKKRQLPEKNSDSNHTRNHPRMSSEKKRTRISYSSSEASEDDEESMALEDPSMGSEANHLDHGCDNFDYDPPVNNHYDDSLEHNIIDPILERNIATPEVTDDVEEEEEKKEEESSASSSAKIESMSLLELSNHLRLPILKYTPTLIPRIDENIKKLESEDQQIPINKVLGSFESCIQILNTPDEMDPDENTTALSDFFFHLGMAMCNITHPSMDDFHVKMRKLATTGDKKVSMEHIRYAMGKTLDKILH